MNEVDSAFYALFHSDMVWAIGLRLLELIVFVTLSIILLCKLSDIRLELWHINREHKDLNQTLSCVRAIGGELCQIDGRLSDLVADRAEFSFEILKDVFLARKDSEGVMLIEAAQKQYLKKRRKKSEVPSNSTSVS